MYPGSGSPLNYAMKLYPGHSAYVPQRGDMSPAGGQPPEAFTEAVMSAPDPASFEAQLLALTQPGARLAGNVGHARLAAAYNAMGGPAGGSAPFTIGRKGGPSYTGSDPTAALAAAPQRAQAGPGLTEMLQAQARRTAGGPGPGWYLGSGPVPTIGYRNLPDAPAEAGARSAASEAFGRVNAARDQAMQAARPAGPAPAVGRVGASMAPPPSGPSGFAQLAAGDASLGQALLQEARAARAQLAAAPMESWGGEPLSGPPRARPAAAPPVSAGSGVTGVDREREAFARGAPPAAQQTAGRAPSAMQALQAQVRARQEAERRALLERALLERLFRVRNADAELSPDAYADALERSVGVRRPPAGGSK